MSDLIKREDAIKELSKVFANCEPCDKEEASDIAVTTIKELPSADRPQGEWLDYNGKPTTADYSGTCSVCGTWSEYLLNYCPNCGCRMRGADDERDG